ncbi:hypothetical protein [Chryseobacterium sp.]|uniref:hypothetical protein n=1 Tax=Chryseobacterium sp. TaxID=1871047 RepID=UPI00289A3BED|nr:hypothetical protein [Chryseobacterium sp.]
MKKLNLFIIFLSLLALTSCNKAEKMKNKFIPDRPYEDAKIDNFYWADGDKNYRFIPLLKPYRLSLFSHNEKWSLDTGVDGVYMEFDNSVITKISSIEPVIKFNVANGFIYGIEDKEMIDEKSSIPVLWFIYNVSENDLKLHTTESAFKTELKKLNLPETFLNPDEVFEQYKNDPVLPWFPDDIKRQLEEVKARK